MGALGSHGSFKQERGLLWLVLQSFSPGSQEKMGVWVSVEAERAARLSLQAGVGAWTRVGATGRESSG